MKVIFINPNLDGSPIPNLGLAYVLSSVQKDHRVSLVDMGFDRKKSFRRLLASIKEERPDVLGFSVNTFTFHHGLRVAALVKEAFPGIPVVFGGVHPTLLPEETIGQPLVDAICIGEGEDTFAEYLRVVEAKGEPAGVAGIWYKDAGGSIIRNPLRPFREDIDSLAFPDWDYWDIDRYLKTNLYFVGSIGHLCTRGCPYSCAFCSNPAIKRAIPGTFYRQRSPENVIEEILRNRVRYAGRGFRNLAFGDATFGLEIGRLEQFCSLYRKAGLSRQLPWVCQTRADLITGQWAELVASAGCCMVTLGIESGNEYMRTKVFKKEITDGEVLSAVENLRRNKIMFAFNMIIGNPEETRESIRDSVRIIKRCRPVNSYLSFFQPLPKTELRETRNLRIVTSEGNLRKAWNTPRIATDRISLAELERFMLRRRVEKVLWFFFTGIRLKGIEFLITVFKYVFSIGGYRTMSLRNPYMEVDLEQRTLYPYILENWKREYLKDSAIK